jgi:DNA polymerase-3 subunit alpha
VALVRQDEQTRFVRLGSQFCIDNPQAAIATLRSADFSARVSSPLLAA